MCYLDITLQQIIWLVKLSKPSYGNVIVFLVNTIIPKIGGACVHGVIWLIVCMIGQINLNECGRIIRSYIYLPLLFNSKCRRGHSPVQMTYQEIRCTEAIYPGQIYGIL